MGKGIGGHTRAYEGKSNDWITPKHIIDALGVFDLDPSACIPQPWMCANQSYTIEDDGLSKEWFGRVWLNPPYGKESEPFLERLWKHGDGIALIFARTETAMFFKHVWEKADGLLFLKGRLFFHHPDGTRASSNSGGPSVLIAYGDKNVKALECSGLPGSLIKEWIWQ